MLRNIPVLSLIAISLTVTSTVLAQQTDLVDFELEDQFGEVHRRADVQGTIVLLIGSDKGGSSFNGLWGKAIHDLLRDHPHYEQISQLAYSDLRGVPFFLKGMIRSKFPENPDSWALMDWKGIIAKAYDFVPKSSNVLVFSPRGELVQHVSGREVVDETVQEIVAVLRDLLDEASRSER